MRIGELSTRAGVSIDSVRYCERRGVLSKAPRTASGYRLFGEEDVTRLGFLRQLQDLGFTLDRIVDALQVHDRGEASCASEGLGLEAVAVRVDERIVMLKATRRLIDRSLRAPVLPSRPECISIRVATADREPPGCAAENAQQPHNPGTTDALSSCCVIGRGQTVGGRASAYGVREGAVDGAQLSIRH